MLDYNQTMNLYFELKGTPESSRESYLRRLKAFAEFIQDKGKGLEDITQSDIQQYILYLKREKALSAGTINNYISSIRFFLHPCAGQRVEQKENPPHEKDTQAAGNSTKRGCNGNPRWCSQS